MTTYEFPSARGAQYVDDPSRRLGFLAPRRADFDPEGAHDARTPEARTRPRPGLGAPPTGRLNLWVPIGPNFVPNGQAAGRPRVSGRIRALAVHPDGQRIYAAAANGGVWYSSDGGQVWKSLGGFAPSPGLNAPRVAHRHSCGAILVTFGATEDLDDVFVGTGEPVVTNGLPGGTRGGIGVLSAVGPVGAAATGNPWTVEGQAQFEGAGIWRLVREPAGNRILAATTRGLFRRGAGPGDPWTRIGGFPFSTFQGRVTDVAWTPAGGGVPKRIWAWVHTGQRRGLWFRNDGDTDWTRVAMPGLGDGRAVIAAPSPATSLYVFHDLPVTNNNELFRVNATVNPMTVDVVGGVPNVVGRQGFYDMTMAVDPALQTRLVLGGSFVRVLSPDGLRRTNEGAIWRGTVPAGAAPAFTGATHIGIGCHADVHDLTFSNAGARLWTGCDGGVFRSDNPARPAGFYPCNDRVSVIESNYLAVHPRLEGFIVAGLQDNGIIELASSSVWRHTGDGDGGGVVLRPDSPNAFIRQFFNGRWTPNEPLVRPGVLAATTQAEIDASTFYSQPAGTTHVRPAAPGVTLGQVLIGTNRVWFTNNFGTTWATLPTGTDAALPVYLPAQDILRSSVIGCRWQGPDEAWVLTHNEVYQFTRAPGSDNAASVGVWARRIELRRDFPSPAGSARARVKQSRTWTDLVPNPDAGGARRGPRGAFYIGTVGHPERPEVDTLYWFDGDLTLHATGLRSEAGGVPAPVTAIACDPANPDHVYVGTTVGVWRGIRTFAGANPDWNWAPLVNGLPEATVEDLSLFTDGGVRLLRAAMASRGVWEMQIDVDTADLTYVRVHEDDLRHRATSIIVNRNLVGERSWHASPDIRPRSAATAITGPTAAAPWTVLAPPSPTTLRRFQASLRSRFADPRFRSNGLWDSYFDLCLRDHGVPLVGGTATITPAFFTTVMTAPHTTAELWPGAIPTEADLHDFVPPLPEGAIGAASMTVTRTPYKVDVVVHRRGLDPIPGADARVTLLQWRDPDILPWNWARPNDITSWFQGNVPWTAAANEVLNSPTGVPSTAFGDGWSFVGTNAATRRRSPATELDNLNSGVVTFDLDFTGVRNNTVVLLVAAIRADGPSSLAPATLRNLTLGNPHVAVRSLRVKT